MKDKKRSFVYGPVPSRRLGRSLGVDLAPFKTCSYNCIYCQLGRTTCLTVTRDEYVPISEVLEQLWHRLAEDALPDYITVSGSGEPTLHSGIGDLIESIKKHTSIPVAVLTNGSLLWDKQVQTALLGSDLVVPSLDAGNPTLFKQINRPHPALDFDRVVDGIAEFRRLYRGKIWLEVLLLDGMNSKTSNVLEIKRQVDMIHPDVIQLNTVVRPPAEESALRVPAVRMEEVRALLGEHAEVIVPYENIPRNQKGKIIEEEVLALLQRRPCTLEDVASGLGVHRNEVVKYLASLKENNLVQEIDQDGLSYFVSYS